MNKIIKTNTINHTENNLEEFLAKVIIAPPGQKITPCKELTPEEIMSFIIPPPPGLGDELKQQQIVNNINKNLNKKLTETEVPNVPNHNYEKNLDKLKEKNLTKLTKNFEENLYINSINMNVMNQKQQLPQSPLKHQPKSTNSLASHSNSSSSNSGSSSNNNNSNNNNINNNNNRNKSHPSTNHVIEYPTIERKGPFSCCTKSKKEDSPVQSPIQPPSPQAPLVLPPRKKKSCHQ
jgi:hypothetical protein